MIGGGNGGAGGSAMSEEATTADGAAMAGRAARPDIAAIGLRDVRAALALGLRDLRRAPLPGLSIGAFFVLGGLCIYLLVALADLVFLAYPMAAGFVLLGPFAAVSLYETSRRIEAGEQPSWRALLGVTTGSGARSLGWMPMLNLFVFIIWVDVAAVVFMSFFGLRGLSLAGLLTETLTTTHGLVFLLAGNLIGALFAFAVFSSTVFAYPLLLDRDADFVTAIATSWRAVLANPVPMLGYGATVGVLTLVALLPALLGLVVVLPWLGHATWHLYRMTVRWPDGSGGAGRAGTSLR